MSQNQEYAIDARNSFKKLFEPRSIAVVGVSDVPTRPACQTVRALLKNGYAGNVFPVNPKYEIFEGLKCYQSVSAIEERVDMVVIGIPAKGVLPVLEECAAKGVAFAVVLSGGFRESGPEGVELENQILDLVRRTGMRVIGPNCLGLANICSNVYAAFGSITRDPKLKAGAVSLVTQSGGFGYSIALACAEANIGFRHVIATGNESDVDTIQLIDALLDDPETGFILAYLEGTARGRALYEVGKRALRLGKPILLWKAGVTAQGAKAAESHTASMTGSYDFYQALFKQTGIIEIQEIHEAVDYLKVLLARKRPTGRAAAVMGVSGGSAIVFADAGENAGIRMAVLGDESRAKLIQVVPGIGAVHNPVDLTAGYFTEANREKLEKAIRATLDDDAVSALCINIATTGNSGAVVAADVLRHVSQNYTKPVVVFSSAPRGQIGEALDSFSEGNIPVLASPARAAKALAMLCDYHECAEKLLADERHVEPPVPTSSLLPVNARGKSLSEAESKAILQATGVPITREVIVQHADCAVFERLKAPLVVKIVSADIAHKTEMGGVKVGVQTREELDAAMQEVIKNAKTHCPNAKIDGVLVAEMVRGGFELIAGVVNDTVFGPIVVVGQGGIYAEVFKDTSCRLAPFNTRVAHDMLRELDCFPVLTGARGLPALDVDAACSALVALSQFAWQNRDRVKEVDINPLFVLEKGVVAADALIVPSGA